MEPEKPFACSLPDCGMTFTNEDHLHVHTKKHDMVLQLGMEQRAAFVADQTPTPTRFIRNCEEVGLFQDLQNVAVNPFDEGFKRAMETKHGILSLEGATSNEDALHTPHLVFPLEAGDCTLYTANNQQNITISRSSSDESGAVKEYETTKISKLTNEVTTISRIVGKDILDRVTTTDDVSIIKHGGSKTNKDGVNETSVSYTNNVIKIHSNVEIRKDNINIDTKKTTAVTNTDSVIKDTINIDVLLTDSKKDNVPPIMSQKSLDFVVDSLTSDTVNRDQNIEKNLKRKFEIRNKTKSPPRDKSLSKLDDDYEVIIKLPNGKHVRMKAVEETERPASTSAKEKLKRTIQNKIEKPLQRVHSIPNAIVQNIVPIATGTLIPVTIMNSTVPILQNTVPKIPIVPLTSTERRNYKTVKRKTRNDQNGANDSNGKCENANGDVTNCSEGENWRNKQHNGEVKNNSKYHLDSRSAASRRYRERLKVTMQKQNDENKHLREANRRLTEEKAVLQLIITQHLEDCPAGDDLSRNLQERLGAVTSRQSTM